MPAEIHPPELARVVDFAERPRADDWSFRAALVRYAQPEPQRVNDLLDLVRRTEAALAKHRSTVERNGDALWAALEGNADADVDTTLLGLLRVARAFDELGDTLAQWAVDISQPRPDDAVDDVIDEVGQQLDALGVPYEERPPGPRNRG